MTGSRQNKSISCLQLLQVGYDPFAAIFHGPHLPLRACRFGVLVGSIQTVAVFQQRLIVDRQHPLE